MIYYLIFTLVDESDPDIDLPNIIHAFQTAEQIRAKHPDKEWFQLTGLIHDLGKVKFRTMPHRTGCGICRCRNNDLNNRYLVEQYLQQLAHLPHLPH